MPLATSGSDMAVDSTQRSATPQAEGGGQPTPRADDPQRTKSGTIMPRRVQVMIFALLCQAVQAFMAYDGGATPASLDTIQEEMKDVVPPVVWTSAEMGLIGAMDKVGMTATSILWGRALQLFPTKYLLLLGLFLNAAATACFGSLQQKPLMYGAKFFMGASQSLQSVWATVWTVTWAPAESKTTWLGLTAVSAGIGNGIGTAVAGFATSYGFPYAFAFQLQAEFLFALWIFMLFTNGKWLATRKPEMVQQKMKDAHEGPASNTFGRANTMDSTEPLPPPPSQQIRIMLQNKVYCWTVLAISIAMFVTSGVQFYWIRMFLEVWGLDKQAVTLLFLVVTGIGGGVGIAFGPPYIDRRGGFGTDVGVYRSLASLRLFALVACAAASVGICAMAWKVNTWHVSQLNQFDTELWLLLASVFFTFSAQNACIPVLFGINVGVCPAPMRTFASGMEMTSRNILGYASGALVPGIFMDYFAAFFGWNVVGETASPLDIAWQACVGFAFVLSMNVVSLLLLHGATRAAGALCDPNERSEIEAGNAPATPSGSLLS